MNIEELKETLGDEKFTQLKTFVDDLTGQRDAARNESIAGRKGLKEKVTKLESDQATLLEKLGIDSLEDLDNLPDAKGMAEAAKQYDAKLKRLERENATLKADNEATQVKFKTSTQRAAIADALSGHEFVARDLVETYISQRLTWEGEDMLFKSDDGKLLSLKDGVAGLVKTRPELLKPTGTGGAGTRQGTGGAPTKGDFGGDRKERTAAIAARFPNLPTN